MRRSGRSSLLPRICHGLLVAAAGLAYLVAAIGFPLPARSGETVGSHACAGRGCGCATEAQCREACCCFKPAVENESACCHEPVELADPLTIHWVQGMRHRECSGMTTSWLATGATLPPPPLSELAEDVTPAGQVVPAADALETHADLLDTPPPRARGRQSPEPLSQQAGLRRYNDEPAFRPTRPAGNCGER